MNKRWYIHTMKYYTELKRNELLTYQIRWRNLKCILLSKRSHPGKATYCMIPMIPTKDDPQLNDSFTYNSFNLPYFISEAGLQMFLVSDLKHYFHIAA